MKKPAAASLKKAAVMKGSLKKDSDSGSSLKKDSNSGGSLKKDSPKNKLNSQNLKKLGELSLKEKIQAAAEENSDEEQAALVLHSNMTPVEKSNAWNQHQNHLKKEENKSLKKEFDSLDKKGKGLATSLFLLKKNKAIFGSVSKTLSKEDRLKKREKWLSQKEADAKWTEKELQLHCASGRVKWRECPDTWDVYEYMDTKDFEKSSVGKNKYSWQYGHEYEMDAEDEEEWGANFEKDLHSLTLEGLGKGNALSLEKGKGKSKGKGKGKHKSTEDKPLEDGKEELTLEETLKKVTKTKVMLLSCISNFEEALKKVEKSPYLSKQSLKDKKAVQQSLEAMLKSNKKFLEKGNKNKVEQLKEHLVDAVSCMKDAKEEAKELVQIGMKALSKASSSKGKA